jgi:hypothetical protein
MELTVGVDRVDGQLEFFVSDSTRVSIENISATGRVTGDLGIRSLLHVAADMKAMITDLDARASFVDPNQDGKIRLADLSQLDVKADIDGSITVDGSLSTDIPLLDFLSWNGRFEAKIVDSQINVGNPVLTAPGAADVLQSLISQFTKTTDAFDPLGDDVGSLLRTKLPVIDVSLFDKLGIGQELSWLITGINSQDTSGIVAELERYGVHINISANSIWDVIHGRSVDLVKFELARDSRDPLWRETLESPALPIPIGIGTINLKGTVGAEFGGGKGDGGHFLK